MQESSSRHSVDMSGRVVHIAVMEAEAGVNTRAVIEQGGSGIILSNYILWYCQSFPIFGFFLLSYEQTHSFTILKNTPSGLHIFSFCIVFKLSREALNPSHSCLSLDFSSLVIASASTTPLRLTSLKTLRNKAKQNLWGPENHSSASGRHSFCSL